MYSSSEEQPSSGSIGGSPSIASSRPMRTAKQGAMMQMSAMVTGGQMNFYGQSQQQQQFGSTLGINTSQPPFYTDSQFLGTAGGDQPFEDILSNPNILSQNTVQSSDASHLADSDYDPNLSSPQPSTGRGRKRRSDESSPEMGVASKRGRGRGRGGTRGRGRGALSGAGPGPDGGGMHHDEALEDDGTLYGMVRAGRVAMQQTVDDWIEDYKKNRDAAMLHLMQFFINSSGCKGRITAPLMANADFGLIIRKMTEEFDEDSGDYPLIMAGNQWKRFRHNYGEFIQVLVKQCQKSIIYDQYMMDSVITMLTGLADSQVRAFRHTATLGALKLTSALVEVALACNQQLEYQKRQYEAERAKPANRRASERLEVLLSNKQSYEENLEELRNMIAYIFKSVFVHRYRDILADIRSICVTELGVWMDLHPTMFLDDSYLKYIGWTLYDRSGEVRVKCLNALLPLYQKEELVSRLELFTNKFKDRIIEMSLDKEFEVAVLSVRLAIWLLKYHEVVTDNDAGQIYELVFSSHRGLATAAGEFLNARLLSRDNVASKLLRTKRGKKRSTFTPMLKDLINFFIRSELHEHGAYLVDALIESNEMVKDWEGMTDLLLEEPGRDEHPLDNQQETYLIEIMVCAVKQVATGEPPVGRVSQKRQYVSQKEQRQLHDDKLKLSEHFAATLPTLLAKYAADTEKIINLLHIPLYFDLEVYTMGRQDKFLDLLLQRLEEVFEKHNHMEILEACTAVYDHLCSENLPQNKCSTALTKLIDNVCVKFRVCMQQFASQDDMDEEDTFSFRVSMRKVVALYSFHDLHNYELYDSIAKIFSPPDDDERSMHVELITLSLKCGAVALMWELRRIEEREVDNNRDRLLRLKSKVDHYLSSCSEVLQFGSTIAEGAFCAISDLLILYGPALAERNPTLENLVVTFNEEQQTRLVQFVVDQVFTLEEEELDDHDQIRLLHRRRNMLAGYCKLIIYGVFPIKMAAEIIRYYSKFYNDYGDIIKHTLAKCREHNKVQCAKAIVTALKSIFTELRAKLDESESDDVRTEVHEGFIHLRDLAKKFALSFGVDQLKHRKAVVAVHTEAINFSLQGLQDDNLAPQCIAFLEIASEFISKLCKDDKKILIKHLDRKVGKQNTRGEDWAALQQYRNALMLGEDGAIGVASSAGVSSTTGGPPAKRGRGRPPLVATPRESAEFNPLATSTVTKALQFDDLSIQEEQEQFSPS